MAFNDLRDWIDDLDERRDLKRIRAQSRLGRGDWRDHAGSIEPDPVRRCSSRISTIIGIVFAAALFTNGTGTRERVCRFIGVPETTSYREMVPIFKDRFSRPVKPVTVANGPVKENILRGAEIDLFPIPGAEMESARRRPLHHDFGDGRDPRSR